MRTAKELRRCVKCLMAETKPGIIFDEVGVCQACRHHEARDLIDWDLREVEFARMLDAHRSKAGNYDCIIPVSGGKDSYFQTWLLKRKYKMNPLLVTVSDPFSHTGEGHENLRKMAKNFDCDIIGMQTAEDTTVKLIRTAFEQYGSPTWPIDRAIYCFPVNLASQLGIPLVFYGENVSYEYGGVQNEESPSAKKQVLNTVALDVLPEITECAGVPRETLNQYFYNPSVAVNPQYLSYYFPWSGSRNLLVAEAHGFQALCYWDRKGYVENYDQIDSIGYLFNAWMKYPKFGFQRVTDVVGYWLRDGLITVEEGKKMIEEKDYLLDEQIYEDFLRVTGYKEPEFWNIVRKHQRFEIGDQPCKNRMLSVSSPHEAVLREYPGKTSD